MRKRLPKFYFKFYLMMIAFSLEGSAPAQLQHTPSPSEDSVKKFLRDYLKDTGPAAEDTIRYFAAFVDLNGDGRKEVIVYLTGKGWCGSGGCNSLVLAPEGSLYKVVTSISITWPPIRVLDTKTNGWHNIGVWVQGGGIQPGYEAELRYDGRTYPSNPSVPPARRIMKKMAGKVVVQAEPEGTPLY